MKKIYKCYYEGKFQMYAYSLEKARRWASEAKEYGATKVYIKKRNS